MIERASFIPDLMIVLTKLIDIIESENAILAERRPKDIEPLLAEKTRLSKVYARMSEALKSDRSLLAEAGEEVVSALKELARSFDEALERQRVKLEVACEVTEGMIAAVGRAVVERRQPVLGYGRDASVRTAVSGGASFALNQSV
jgi:hypothetical protein